MSAVRKHAIRHRMRSLLAKTADTAVRRYVNSYQKVIVYHFTVIMNNLLLAGGDAGQTITAARYSPHTSTAAKKHVNELHVFIDVAQTAAHDAGPGVYAAR